MTFTGRVLALDLATTTGWAFGCPGSIPLCGHIRFSKPGTPRAQTFRAYRQWLDDAWGGRDQLPDLIVYESPAVGMQMQGKTNVETLRLLGGLPAILEEWCVNKVDLCEATVAQVRAHFVGSNMRAKIARPLTLERCQVMGWPVTTQDEADAAALWSFECAWLNPQLAWRHTPLFSRRSP
jgi:crossover junction endodeoxyribonuclease RuvC